MKKKLKLKTWVKALLLLLPEIIIVIQLFFIGQKIEKTLNVMEAPKTIIIEMRCENGQK